jgi:hypothetical protein
MILFHGMLEWLKINKCDEFYYCKLPNNPVGVPEEDWKIFLESEEIQKISKALDKVPLFLYHTPSGNIHLQNFRLLCFEENAHSSVSA